MSAQSSTNSTDPGANAGQGALDFKLYRYTPSLEAAIVAVVVFTVLTIIHGWRMAQHRAFYFTAFTIGGCFQVVGYTGRIWSHFSDKAIGGFVMQAILILVAPALYAASIYMVLGRIIRSLGAERLSFIPVKWLTKIFVMGDIASFTMQAGGGGVQSAGTIDMFNIGEKLIIIGLFVQIVMFGIFVITTVNFHNRLNHWPTPAAIRNVVRWKRHLFVLYATSSLILVRSVFRVVEYLQGNGGYLISHEIFLYIFDAVLMAVTMLIFGIWYIGDLEPKVSFGQNSSQQCWEAVNEDPRGNDATEMKSLV